MLATSDPAGLPLVTQVVSGARADTSRRLTRCAAAWGRAVCYIGGCELMALAMRAHLAAGAITAWRMSYSSAINWNLHRQALVCEQEHRLCWGANDPYIGSHPFVHQEERHSL